MESSFQPLPVETVAGSLANLPRFRITRPEILLAARTDLARAIASGQDAGQLAADLSSPPAWFGAGLTQAAGAAATTTQAAPPAWALTAAQAAVQAKSALRVAVLDRDPAGMSSLSLPAWAQGQKAIATYGPLAIENAAAQVTFQKWIKIYIIPVQMVSFVRGTTTLFVAPLAASGSYKTVNLAGGSASTSGSVASSRRIQSSETSISRMRSRARDQQSPADSTTSGIGSRP